MTELGLETSIGTASGPTRGRRTGQHALGHVHTRPERPTHWASTAAACPQSKSAPRSNPHSARCTSVPHVPRLRALALLRRRPSARVETTAMPASEKPAQIQKLTRQQIIVSLRLLLGGQRRPACPSQSFVSSCVDRRRCDRRSDQQSIYQRRDLRPASDPKVECLSDFAIDQWAH